MPGPDVKARARDVLTQMLRGGGDLGYMEDALPPLSAFLAEVATPDFSCVMVGMAPAQPVTYAGVDGLAEAWSDWGEAFEKVRAVLEEVRESDDHIVLLVDQIATTRHHGVEISQPSAMVFEFAGEGLRQVEFHLDRAAALRAAGLEP